ncbi:hypothetical protein [Lentibacillus salinarum]|uniref:Uncharacterized protein n=1 Tax=Lentibacillus salinarum TaxID=446820 RepID=A0ABW3ZQL4_9BACI
MTAKRMKQMDGYQKQDFANALAEMGNQLRLLEQKITMITDDQIETDYQSHHCELLHITYTTTKLQQLQRSDKKLTPSRFTRHVKKRLS